MAQYSSPITLAVSSVRQYSGSIPQSGHGFIVVVVCRTNVCNHHCLGISSQRVCIHSHDKFNLDILRSSNHSTTCINFTKNSHIKPPVNEKTTKAYEPCRSRVSFESRYGMCELFPSTSAEMTLPSADRLKLIFVASFSRSP